MKNIIERVIAVCKHEVIEADFIKQMLEDQHEAHLPAWTMSNEVEEIAKALALRKGKYTEAAKLLGISRSTLWRKRKRYGSNYS